MYICTHTQGVASRWLNPFSGQNIPERINILTVSNKKKPNLFQMTFLDNILSSTSFKGNVFTFS